MYLSENAKEKIRQLLMQYLQRQFESDLRQEKNDKRKIERQQQDEQTILKTRTELEEIFS